MVNNVLASIFLKSHYLSLTFAVDEPMLGLRIRSVSGLCRGSALRLGSVGYARVGACAFLHSSPSSLSSRQQFEQTPKDDMLNIPPHIISKLDEKLYKQENHPLEIIKRLIFQHFEVYPCCRLITRPVDLP